MQIIVNYLQLFEKKNVLKFFIVLCQYFNALNILKYLFYYFLIIFYFLKKITKQYFSLV